MRVVARVAWILILLAGAWGLHSLASPPEIEPATITFTATAYALDGVTRSGEWVRPGIVAADPAVLPLGSQIRITGAGEYSGEYTVLDTGLKIKGQRIDIYMESTQEAREFGRQRVEVEILSLPGNEET